MPQTESDLRNVGIHWTTDLNMAKAFAAGDFEPDFHDGTAGGHILEAQVDPAHVVQPGTDEWKQVAAAHDILDEGEGEVTVRRGAPVNVTGLYSVETTTPGAMNNNHGETARVTRTKFDGGNGTA